MAVKISDVRKNSPCAKKHIAPGDTLVAINGNEINDVLDYRFFSGEDRIKIEYMTSFGQTKKCHIRNCGDIDNIGLVFDTYLMDKQQHCKNGCVFCFIDQMPCGLRESLYFKDDDSRLSFLFGNYITLTNLSEHDVERIIRFHISPVNVSVHTMDPSLRVRMMKNPNAGTSLGYLKMFSDAGIAINAQLVLCPGINDGDALRYSLERLSELETVESIAAVPVGLTKYREKLYPLRPFECIEAEKVIDMIDIFNGELEKTGRRKLAYPSDEFYLLAKRELPGFGYYGDFPQLDNGVGMCALTEHDFLTCFEAAEGDAEQRNIAVATGAAAYPLIKKLADIFMQKYTGSKIEVLCIKNKFFGELVTVAGLITGRDLIDTLQGRLSPDTHLLLPSVMFKGKDELIFLDDISVGDVGRELGVKVDVTGCGGDDLFYALERAR